MENFDRFKDYLNLSDVLNPHRELQPQQQLEDQQLTRCSHSSHVETAPETTVFLSHASAYYGFQNFTHSESGSVADLLQLETTTHTDQDDASQECSTYSICESFAELTLDVPEGRPLLGIHSLSSGNSCSSDNSQQLMSADDTDVSSLGDDNFMDFQTLLRQAAPRSHPRHTRPPRPSELYCVLCKRNGETKEYYRTHVLKDNRGKVICPILRKYVCPRCRATGDNAHTLRHCPFSDLARLGSMSDILQTNHSSC